MLCIFSNSSWVTKPILSLGFAWHASQTTRHINISIVVDLTCLVLIYPPGWHCLLGPRVGPKPPLLLGFFFLLRHRISKKKTISTKFNRTQITQSLVGKLHSKIPLFLHETPLVPPAALTARTVASVAILQSTVVTRTNGRNGIWLWL